jgi:ribonuclease P protein component
LIRKLRCQNGKANRNLPSSAAFRSSLLRAFLMSSTSKPAPRQTLAHSRLRKHADYLRAYAAGRKWHSAAMSWFLAPAPQAAPQTTEGASAPAASRVGLTVGKIMGKAHERNRIKRRMREALRRHIDLLPAGFDLILHPRRTVLTMEFAQLEREVVRILQQAEAQAREHVQKQVPTDAPRPAKRSASTATGKPAS